MKTAKFLFWLGVVVIIAEFVANLVSMVHVSVAHVVDFNWSFYIISLFGSFTQGGLLIGVGKILEAIHDKR